MTINLALNAKVNKNSKIIGMTKEQIEKQYNIIILSIQRITESFHGTKMVSRLVPSGLMKIIEKDSIEVQGNSDDVMKFLKICEV